MKFRLKEDSLIFLFTSETISRGSGGGEGGGDKKSR